MLGTRTPDNKQKLDSISSFCEAYDPSAPLEVSKQTKVADLAVPTRVKLHPWKKTFQHDDLSFMVVAGRPVYPGRSSQSSRKGKGIASMLRIPQSSLKASFSDLRVNR
jgi:hypothetical protein